jgi:diamine N-acetyltransferase
MTEDFMPEIEYIETDQQGLDSIGFLWKKLNEHHRVRSQHFARHFSQMTWDIRKKKNAGENWKRFYTYRYR